MKILFVSGELIGSAICQKLHNEGNEVKLYIHKQDWKNCLDGIVAKVKNWRKELDWVGCFRSSKITSKYGNCRFINRAKYRPQIILIKN